jgi:hypothetical protein
MAMTPDAIGAGTIKRLAKLRTGGAPTLSIYLWIVAGLLIALVGCSSFSGGNVAAAEAAAPLTATGVRIGDHPAYVRAVVDFANGTFIGRQVQATDPEPFDGTAGVRLSYPKVVTRASARTADGITVRVVEGAGRLSIDLHSAAGEFKYLSYAVVAGDRLAIDLWKSFSPSKAAEVRRGKGGCLTLGSVRVHPGAVSATGTSANLFENRSLVVVRAAFGGVLAQRSVSTSGHWSVKVRYTAPQGQGGTVEAVAFSPKDGALACLVQQGVALPASNARANLRVVYRAHADVDGNGKPDLVTLRRTSSSGGRLQVVLSSGRLLSVNTPTDAVWLPGLVATGNVDGRPGDELLVDVTHVTTAETIYIYTYWHGRLRLAGRSSAYGYDYGTLSGLTCSVQGSKHFITEHDFSLQPPSVSGHWTRQDTRYVWQGPSLKLSATHPAYSIQGNPSPALVGVQCGHAPAQ